MSDYRFESQTVADKLSNIIDASIGYVSKKQQKDKYFRGTTTNVASTTADVYLFNSSTPIPNVKIGSGIRHLFNDEDVYLVAIGGKLNNCIIDKRVIDYNLVYEDEIDNFLTIDDFSEITNTWVCTAPLTATLIPTNDYYKLYTASKKTNYLIAANTYIFQASVDNIDLTKFHDLDASAIDDVIFFSFFMGTGVENIDFVELRFYKNSNYYSFNLQHESIVSGWNRIKQTKSSFTNSGMSGWSNIDKITVTINYATPVLLTYFVNFAYLGMASLFKSTVVNDLSSQVDAIDTKVNDLDDRVDATEEDITALETNKQDKHQLLTDISALTGTGLLAKSTSNIYIPTLSPVANQTAITFNPSTAGNITIGFATDYLKLFTKNAKFGLLFTDYIWSEDLAVIELGAGANLSIPTISAETNEFLISNNFYKNTSNIVDNIFAGSGSSISMKRDEINFVVTETPGSFADSSFLRIRETYTSSTPLAKVQIAGNQVVLQSNITLRTAVLDWYYDICKVIQVGDTGAVFAYVETDKNINISQNLLFDNTNHDYRRIEATQATLYQQKKGEHAFYIAGTGAIGSEITFTQAFKIDNSGNFYLGSRKLTVSATEPSTPTTGDLWLDVSS